MLNNSASPDRPLLKAVIWVALLIAIPVVVFGLYWDKHHPLPTRARTTTS